MLTHLFLTLFISISYASSYNFDLSPKLWEKIKMPGAEKAWKNKYDKAEFFVINRGESPVNLSFEDKNSKQIRFGLESMRKATLYNFKFKNWSTFYFNVKKNKTYNEVKWMGEYLNPKGIKTYFIEYQWYQGKRFTQLGWYGHRHPKDKPEIKKLMNQFVIK